MHICALATQIHLTQQLIQPPVRFRVDSRCSRTSEELLWEACIIWQQPSGRRVLVVLVAHAEDVGRVRLLRDVDLGHTRGRRGGGMALRQTLINPVALTPERGLQLQARLLVYGVRARLCGLLSNPFFRVFVLAGGGGG